MHSSSAVTGVPSPSRRQKVWIALPAYNEEAALPALLASIEEAMDAAATPYGVVVVDDGSRDRTAEIAAAHAERMPIVLERHPQNLGLGSTIRDGLMRAAALAAPGDVVVTMDADNSHTPELIPRMVQLVREGRDVVVASRYRPGSQTLGVPASRRFLSYVGGLLFRLLFPTPGIRDFTCGFRAYRAALLQSVVAEHGAAFFEQEGFSCMVDILLKLRRRRVVFGEVPLILRYDLKPGASKMRVARTAVDTLLLLARRRLERQ